MGGMMGKRNEPTCAFCKKTQSEVQRMMYGLIDYICDECVALTDQLWLEDGFDIRSPAYQEARSGKTEVAETPEEVAEKVAHATVIALLDAHLGEESDPDRVKEFCTAVGQVLGLTIRSPNGLAPGYTNRTFGVIRDYALTKGVRIHVKAFIG